MLRSAAAACAVQLLSIGLSAQVDTLARLYALTITQRELRQHLEEIASDAYMGRDTGKEGQKMAAAYLREQFVSYGIPPVPSPLVKDGYYQSYELIEERNGSISIRSSGRRLDYPSELLYRSEVLTESLSIRELVLFRKDTSSLGAGALRGKHLLVALDGSTNELQELLRLRTTLEWAGSSGTKTMFVVVSEELFSALRGEVHAEGGRMRLAANGAVAANGAGRLPQVFFLRRTSLPSVIGRRYAKRLNELPDGARLKTRMDIMVERTARIVVAENVLAYIEGTEVADELLVITAHYDHIGVENGVVYNGADDDGSGTVALLEIAQAFASAKAAGHGPQRSVLIMPVSGEEKGLLGSRHYSENPLFPMERTIANLNIDMIGRTDSAHSASAPYVYVIGSDRLSTDLHLVNEEANRNHVGLLLDYSFNTEDDPNRFYYRSDHYNFARNGVPCIFYFSGVHEDYHQPGDDVEKIQFNLLEQRARLVFHTAWELVNRPERIRVDKKHR